MSARTSNLTHDQEIADLARQIRRASLIMVNRSTASHIGSCLSCADILAHLYGGWLEVDPARPNWNKRDRFILSKGHAAAALYAALALRGFFPKDWLESYCCDDAKLGGHVTHVNTPGVEVSSGSLGHGLPIAVGMALGAKRTGCTHRIAVLLSDGECNEGSNWEAFLLAATHKLDNLLVIIDYNKLQGYGRSDSVALLEPLNKKMESFNLSVKEINGHDHPLISATLTEVPFNENMPSVIIAHTIKGYGVSFMRDSLEWHYRSPSDEQLELALSELELS